MTTITVTAPEQLILAFPNPILPSIKGEPTRRTLQPLHEAIKENASSVSSTNMGGGNHGHLGAVVSIADYAAIAPGTPYVAVIAPPQQALCANNATGAQIAQENMQYSRLKTTYLEYKNMQIALKNQIKAAVDERFIKSLRHPTMYYTNVTAWNMLEHLITTYGNIGGFDHTENLT